MTVKRPRRTIALGAPYDNGHTPASPDQPDLAALLDDVRHINTTLIRWSLPDSMESRYDESMAALGRIRTYLIHAKVDAGVQVVAPRCAACERGDRDTHTQHIAKGKVAAPRSEEPEKERLAQALRDDDMGTFTEAIRKANRAAPAEPER